MEEVRDCQFAFILRPSTIITHRGHLETSAHMETWLRSLWPRLCMRGECRALRTSESWPERSWQPGTVGTFLFETELGLELWCRKDILGLMQAKEFGGCFSFIGGGGLCRDSRSPCRARSLVLFNHHSNVRELSSSLFFSMCGSLPFNFTIKGSLPFNFVIFFSWREKYVLKGSCNYSPRVNNARVLSLKISVIKSR